MPAPKGNKHALGNKGGGRKSSYQKQYAKVAQKMAELGATERDIAEALGVSPPTLCLWRHTHVEFAEALRVGKAPCDDRVEASLYHRATGYTFESEKIFNYQGKVVRAKTIEHVPPETTAAIFWLKNRRKEAWRDKQEIDHTIDLSNMTDEQLADIASGRSNGVIKAPKDKTISH
jgi:hypothetical protein